MATNTGYIEFNETAEPAAPAAGKQRLYIDSSSHKLKRTDSSGVDVTIESTAPTFVGCKAVASGNTTIAASNTEYAIAFAGADAFDSDGFHDPASNNTRLTVPTGKTGYYVIRGQAYVATTTATYVDLKIRKGGGAGTVLSQARVKSDDANTMIQVSCIASLAATDYVELYVMCGDAVSNAASGQSNFEIALIGV